jgi:coatomer subunit alpha
LAYLTAKTNGLEDLAAEILEDAGLDPADIDDIPDFGSSDLGPPPVVNPTGDVNWPIISTGENYFDKALANGALETGVEPVYANGDANGAAASALDDWAKEENEPDIDPEEGGWELDADGGEFQDAEQNVNGNAADEEELDLGAGANPGVDETEHWVRNSPLAVDHIAAGSYDTAMQVCTSLWRASIPTLTFY